MKRIMIAALCLLLCGCTAPQRDEAADVLAQYSRVNAAQMEAEVTFHLSQEARSFTLQCDYAPEESTVRVLQPEQLSGIEATVTAEGLSVAYDGVSAPAGDSSDFGPVHALPYLLKALSSGYLLEQGHETLDERDCLRLTMDTDCGEAGTIQCAVWLDRETLLPLYAECMQDDQVVVSIKMLSFSCTLKEE